MSDLVNRIQDAILLGQGEDKLRQALTELQIPGWREPVPGAVERLRELIYGSGGATEDELREAFADLGLDGSGTGERPMPRIHRAILGGS